MMRRTCTFRVHSSICPKCGNLLSFTYSKHLKRCENCNEPEEFLICAGNACKFSEKICCESNEESEQLSWGHNLRKPEKNVKRPEAQRQITSCQKRSHDMLFCVAVFAIFLIFIICYKWYAPSECHENANIAQVRRLKSHYVSQKNETWFQLLSVLEKEIPTVKSITFLHGEDDKTSNCLTNELVSLYTTNNKVNIEEITFSLTGSEVRDYGFLLQHYHAVVEKFRVLVTDLSNVPGHIARLFHSLCDEESSDIKPSLFIFTLKYDKKTADLKPLERATTILKEAWGNLPQNEIFPLLSRLIKNVVDVVPEQKFKC